MLLTSNTESQTHREKVTSVNSSVMLPLAMPPVKRLERSKLRATPRERSKLPVTRLVPVLAPARSTATLNASPSRQGVTALALSA
jgi:hypothetical protein